MKAAGGSLYDALQHLFVRPRKAVKERPEFKEMKRSANQSAIDTAVRARDLRNAKLLGLARSITAAAALAVSEAVRVNTRRNRVALRKG